MKNISFILFVLAALVVGTGTTSCGSDPVTLPSTDTLTEDTTIVEELNNQIQIRFDLYKLNLNVSETDAYYNIDEGKTVVAVVGNDVDYGNANFLIKFDGKSTGTFTTQNNGGGSFEAGIGEGIKREEFNANSSDLTISVTEYGEVGEMIKGTFFGKVKNINSQSVEVKNGKFEVTRTKDK
ncbi:hypothetical protein N9I68_04605 [Bacteroidia bacterium]|nr:hypothetical protein [Bacteroidia bacterium]